MISGDALFIGGAILIVGIVILVWMRMAENKRNKVIVNEDY